MTPGSRRRWWRALVAIAFIAFASPFATRAAWRARHPAPFGRSAHEVDEALARALPPRASLDSVRNFALHAGLDFGIDSAAGQRTLTLVARDVDSDGMFVLTGVRARLGFDSAWQLVTRETKEVHTGP